MEILNGTGRAFLLTPAEDFGKGPLGFYELSKALVERYGFSKLPKLEDWQGGNGAEFGFGRWENIELLRLIIYVRGVSLDVRASSDEARRILNDMLTWAAATLKVHYRPHPTHRWFLHSELIFTSDLSLNALNPVLEIVNDAMSAAVSEQWRERWAYETTGLAITVDESNVKHSPGQFRLERRLGVAFGDKTYYSFAPIPSDDHRRLLERIEAALTPKNGGEA